MALTWTGGTFESEAFVWGNVVWADALGLFVAVNGGGGTGTDRIATSPDGTTWTTRTTPDQSTDIVVWSEEAERLIVLGTNALMYSDDGINWSAGTPPDSNTWYHAAYSDSLGLWVAAGGTGTQRIATSATGIGGWTLRTTPDQSVSRVAWSPTLSLFVAGTSADNVLVSSNGTSWTSHTVTGADNTVSVIWTSALGGRFVVFNGYTAHADVFTSANGTSWTEEANAPPTTSLAVNDAAPNFVVIWHDYDTNQTKYSESADLTTWSAEDALTDPYDDFEYIGGNSIPSGAYSPDLGVFVFVSQNATYDWISTVGTATSLTSAYFSPSAFDYDEEWPATTITSNPTPLRTPDKLAQMWDNFDGRYIGKAVTHCAGAALVGSPTLPFNIPIYATNDYVVGEQNPQVKAYNISTRTEYPIYTVPPVGTTPAKCITALAASRSAAVLTLDSGADHTDFRGRILFPAGAYRSNPPSSEVSHTFPAGHIPMAGESNGETFFVGTHRGTASQPGAIFNTWPYASTPPQMSLDLSTLAGIGGITCSDRGFPVRAPLFGTDAASGTAAIMLGCLGGSVLGPWTTLFTGPSTAAGNAILWIKTFQYFQNTAIYTLLSYWDPTASQGKIYRSNAMRGRTSTSETQNLPQTIDPSGWTLVHSEPDPIVGVGTFLYTTDPPFDQRLLVWTGGDGVTPKVVFSNAADHTTWTELIHLPETPSPAGFISVVSQASMGVV